MPSILLLLESKQNIKNKNEKSEDYSKADLKQRVLFFIIIFRLAIPAFFRFTDVTSAFSNQQGYVAFARMGNSLF